MDNKSLWDDTSEFKPLRRPNSNSVVNTRGSSSNKETFSAQDAAQSTDHQAGALFAPTTISDILRKSNLRADAKEWFPSNYTEANLHLTQPAQNRLQRIKHGIAAAETTYAETSQAIGVFDSAQIDILIKSLIYDPGQFDNLVENFIAIIEDCNDDIDVINKTAKVIIENAIREPCFRYNGARLCSILHEHFPLFRPQLHMLCEKELNSDKQLQGLTLFLAELFMQLPYETIYGQCVLTSIRKLILTNVPDDVKGACQALKLAGYSLESGNTKALDEIFQILEEKKQLFQQPLINLVQLVVTLRTNNWDHTPNSAISGNSLQEHVDIAIPSNNEDFILYGPDGQEVTQDEQDFYYSNFGDEADYVGSESSDPDDLYNPEPEMDKEIQEAFREFVKLSKR